MTVFPLLAVLVQALSGATIDALDAPVGTKAIVYVFTSTDCPISNRYAPEIVRIQQAFAPKGVRFRLVYPGKHEDPRSIQEHMSAFSYTGLEAVRDTDLALVKFAGATITPEVAVVAGGKVVYRGRIDDRFVDLGVERSMVTTHDLRDALASIVAGRDVAVPRTQAVGCYIADLTR
jgi:hypothetical protein